MLLNANRVKEMCRYVKQLNRIMKMSDLLSAEEEAEEDCQYAETLLER